MKDSSEQQSSTNPTVPYWVKIVSGSVGSMVTAIAVTPLEVVKVRQQSQVSSSTTNTAAKPPPANVSPCPRGCGTFVFSNGIGETLLPKNAVPYFDKVTGEYLTNSAASMCKYSKRGTTTITNSNGTLAMLQRIFATEGLPGIYAGLAPTLVMGVPNTVLYFVTYEELASRLRQHNYNQSWAPALAGGAARFIASASTAPLELIRTRQAARIGSAQPAGGMMQEMAQIIRQEGVLALYQGLSPTLFRDVPFSAVYWFCIEYLREKWRERNHANGNVRPTALQQAGQGLVNGSVSGMIAAACTTPLDVVKTRRQTAFIEMNTAAVAAVEDAGTAALCDHAGAAVYNPKVRANNNASAAVDGTIPMMKQILKEEGIGGLWKGNQARMMKVAPACAIMISSYEVGKRLLSEEF